jgi:UDP-N-acetylglucosamine enolpyruvyl transferase
MPPRFQVRGGRPLRGTVLPAGNKNAALPALTATLLADGPVTLNNVPRIRDVETMIALLVDLGVQVDWHGTNTLRVDARAARPKALDPALCARIRASILLAGPLLARFGSVTLPPPGGDVIGRRRVDTHFLALEQLGAELTVGESYKIEGKRLTGAEIFLDEPSVTGTENALLAAVMAHGRTVLRNAAAEPHVQDVARLLIAMGASVEGSAPTSTPSRAVALLAAANSPLAPITSRSRASSGSPRSPTERSRSKASGPMICAAPCSASSGSASVRGWTGNGWSLTPGKSAGSVPTWEAMFPSSRMVPGLRSPRMRCPSP